MTNILNCINELEVQSCGLKQLQVKPVELKQDSDTKDKIVLNPKNDPDPYGYHGLPLKYRLIMMGWPEGIH